MIKNLIKKHKVIMMLSSGIGLVPWAVWRFCFSVNLYSVYEADGFLKASAGYLLILGIFGGLAGSGMSLAALTSWYIIHRKDPKIWQRHYHLEYEAGETDFLLPFCYSIGYIAMGILLLIPT